MKSCFIEKNPLQFINYIYFLLDCKMPGISSVLLNYSFSVGQSK